MQRFLFFLFFLIFCFNYQFAQLISPFNARYSNNAKGGIRIISNVSVACNGGSSCANALNEVPPNGTSTNNEYIAGYVDIDNSPTTFMSSSDSLNLNNCSEILWAGLYWGGRILPSTTNYSSRNTVKLKVNNGAYQTVTATEIIDASSLNPHASYFCFKDITSIVQSAGFRSRFTIANVVTQTGSNNLWGNWSIIVVYKNVFQSMRNLTVFDGFANIGIGNYLDIPIVGFHTPPSGPVGFELGVIAFDGDRGSTGDQMQFNGNGSFQNISDVLHPVYDFFNSAISYNEVLTPFRNPNYSNSFGLDASVFIPPNSTYSYIGNNASSATIRVTTSSEIILCRAITSAIDIYEPDLRADVRINDLNGGNIQPGDILEYTVVAKNIGSDLATNCYLIDSLDDRVSYVPNSLSIFYGPNPGSKTDALSDDQGEYISSSKVIRFRVGSGANGASGGTIQALSSGADSTVIKFKAKVVNDCLIFQCNPTISNVAYLYGKGLISGNEYNNGGLSDTYNSSGCPTTMSNGLNINISGCSPFVITYDTTCVGQTISLSVPYTANGTYSWTGPNGFTSSVYNPTIANASALMAGLYTVSVYFPSIGCTMTASRWITIQGKPTLSLVNQTNVTCYNYNNGTLQVSGSGNAPLSYQWSNNSTATSLSNLSPNTYTVTVTDVNGCTATGSYTITQPTALQASASATTNYNGKNISCNGGSDGAATVTYSGATPPYSVLWSNGATTASISGLSAGTYTATITDAKGCTKTASLTLTQPTVITLSDVKTMISCYGGNNGAIDLGVSGGTPGYTFLWSNGATTEDVSTLTAGTYTVVVTDLNGCTKTRSVTLTQPQAPLSVSSQLTMVACYGNATGAIDATITGGTSPYTYAWSNSATTQDLTTIVSGTYTLTVTDSKQCTQTQTVNITQPAAPLSATLTATNVKCFGNATGSIDVTTTGGTPGYTYVWNTTATTEDVANLLPGAYSVTIKDTKNCTTTGSVQITQPQAPLSAQYTKDDPDCWAGSDGSIDVSVSGGTTPYSYSWTTGQTTEDLQNITSGLYHVQITDANLCPYTLDVTLNQPAAMNIQFSSTAVLCYGSASGALDVSVSGGTTPYSYIWSSGQTTQDISDVAAGTYQLTVTDFNNCSQTQTMGISQPLNPLSLSEVHQDALCTGGQQGWINMSVSGGTPGYVYQWNNNEVTQDIAGLVAGTYSCVVKDANQCSDTLQVTIVDPSSTMAVSETHTVNACYGQTQGSIDVTVTGGFPGYAYSWNSGQTTQDLSNLAAGNYFATITDAHGCQVFVAANITQPNAALTLAYQNFNVLCNGDSTGAMQVTTTGGTLPYSFLWNTGATTEDLLQLPVGTYSLTVRDSNNCVASITQTIYEPLALVIGQAVTLVRCKGEQNGAIDATPAGGVNPYTYQWSTGATSEDIANLLTGTYTIHLTDANGCKDSLDVFVGEPAAVLTIPDVHQSISCYGLTDGVIDITAAGGNLNFSYLWENGSTEEDRDSLPVGTYTVIVTDIKGCTATSSISITQPAAPLSVSATSTAALCHGGASGTATATPSGGTAGYTYLWSNGQTAATATNLVAGTYSVIVEDVRHCQTSTSVVVSEPNALFANADSLDVLCHGASTGSVFVMAVGGVGQYTYTWTTGQTTSLVQNLPSGNYDVVVKDNNNCTLTVSTRINEPDSALALAFTTIDNACFGASTGIITATASGGTSPYNYQWAGGGQTTQQLTDLPSGNYTVTVTDNHNCQLAASASIGAPSLIQSAVVVSAVNCYGGSDGALDVSISGGVLPYAYNWSTTATTEDIDSLTAGNYTLNVSDSNGCVSTFFYTVTQPQQALTLSQTQVNVDCYGNATGSINLTVVGGTPNYNYAWSNNQTTQDIQNLVEGTYSVQVTDNNLCMDTLTVQITQPQAPLSITQTHVDILCYGAATGSIDASVTGGTMPYSYNWNSNAFTTEDLQNRPSGTYNLVVKDHNNCQQTIQVVLTQPQAPIDIQFTMQAVGCFGDSTGALQATITGGTAPYVYGWNTQDSTLSIDSLWAGTYTLSVVDSNQCVYAENVQVTQPQAPLSATYTAQQPGCFGYSDGVLTAQGVGGTSPYNYLWADGTVGAVNDSLPTGNYTVGLVDANGCTFSLNCFLDQPAQISVSFDADQLVGCSPFRVTFGNTSDASTTCYWEFGDGGVWASCDSVHVYNEGGIYDVHLTVSDANGCSNDVTYDHFITVYQSPTAAISADPVILFPGAATTHVTNQSTGGEFYVWNMGESPVNLYTFEPGDYTYNANLKDTFEIMLVAFSADNCPDTAYQQIIFRNDPFYYVPNTFIPDNDGRNDVWNVVFSDPTLVKSYSMQVFDRWGEIVFQTTDLTIGWDGKTRIVNSKAQDGTYTWKMQFEWKDHRTYDAVGHVNLLK